MLRKTTLLCACIDAHTCSDDSPLAEQHQRYPRRHGGNQSELFFVSFYKRGLRVSSVSTYVSAQSPCSRLAARKSRDELAHCGHERAYFNPVSSVRDDPPQAPWEDSLSVETGMSGGGLLRSVWAECDSLRPKGWVRPMLQTFLSVTHH